MTPDLDDLEQQIAYAESNIEDLTRITAKRFAAVGEALTLLHDVLAEVASETELYSFAINNQLDRAASLAYALREGFDPE